MSETLNNINEAERGGLIDLGKALRKLFAGIGGEPGPGGTVQGGWAQHATGEALLLLNPVMAIGEGGYETDTFRWKLGDGTTAWADLPYQDTPLTPDIIENPGATLTFEFRPFATQTVEYTDIPTGTTFVSTLQHPTNQPPIEHEGLMFVRIINTSLGTLDLQVTNFNIFGDTFDGLLATGEGVEFSLWVLAGDWYVEGGPSELPAGGPIANDGLVDVATGTIKGRLSAGTGVVEDLTVLQVKNQILTAGSVLNSLLATISSGVIKGRYTAGTGAVEDLTAEQVRWLTDNTSPNPVSIAINTTLTKALHQGRYLVCSAAVSLTVDTATDFDTHCQTTIRADGGAVTIIATATVNASSGLIIPQYATGILRRMVATDVYSLEIMSHPKIAGADSVAATTASGTTTLRFVSDTATPGNNQVYGTDGTGVRGWKNDPAGGSGATALGGLTDVADVLSPTNDQVLTYSSGTGLWQAGTISAPSGSGTVVDSISALQGIGSPTDGQFVFVRGFSSATDTGGGLFQWNASTTDYKTVTGGSVAAGGTGYTVGQLVWPTTGTAVDNRSFNQFRVTTVSGGAVTGISLVKGGLYSVTPTASAGASSTDVAGTGLTLNLTIVSFTNGIVVAKTGGGTGRWNRRYEGKLNIHWFGAKGNGSTDDSSAIQAAVDTYNPIYFPPGVYITTRAITWWVERTLNISGSGIYGWGTSTISGGPGTEEPMFHPFGRYMKQDGTYQFETGFEVSGNNLGGVGQFVHVENIHFAAGNSIYASCFETQQQQDGFFSNCCFEFPFRGLTLAQANFDVLVQNCRFSSTFMNNFPWAGTTGGVPNRTIAQRAWGLHANGHKTVINCSAVGCGTGFYFVGIENNLIGARIEVNNYGILIGNLEYRMGGIESGLASRSTWRGLSLEANTIGIYVKHMNNCDFQSISIQGSEAAGARPDGEYGLYIEDMWPDNTISGISANGVFTRFAIMNLSSYPIWKADANAARNYGGANSPFILRGSTRPYAHYLATPTPTGRLTFFSDLQHEGLTQLDLRVSAVRARNLGGRVTIAQGATTAAVTFQDQIGVSLIAFNGLSVVADGASTLATATYYYATTTVGWNAEVGVNYNDATIFNHRSIAVTAGQRVDMTFFGGSDTSRYVRRIYRGTVQGAFDGYYQIAMGANFSDTGAAFTATGSPPPDGAIPSTVEADGNYLITCTSQATNAGSIWITNKTTTGFTINCSTAAPVGGHTMSWLMFRA